MRLPISVVFSILCVFVPSIGNAQPQSASKPPAASHSPDIASIVDRKADENGLPSSLVGAIISVESGWKSSARNGSSVGLMQITPGTAHSLGFRGEFKDLFDPETNIGLGTRYLAEAYRLADGDLCATVARYQSGLDSTRPNAANRAYCKKMKALLALNP
jgi:soluble lytic murein transglycosylase-like protein